jgi:signal peptidase I
MRRYVLGLAAGTLFAALALRSEYTLITVIGDSMWPTLAPGDRVLVRRARPGRIRRGQVVVFEAPGTDGYRTGTLLGRARADRQWIIKRVVAVPGDARPDGIPATAAPLVPPGKFVVLGDNLAWSHDSRHIGYVPGDRLLGVVVSPEQPGVCERDGHEAAYRAPEPAQCRRPLPRAEAVAPEPSVMSTRASCRRDGCRTDTGMAGLRLWCRVEQPEPGSCGGDRLPVVIGQSLGAVQHSAVSGKGLNSADLDVSGS